MGFASFGQIFDAFGEKKKIYRHAFIPSPQVSYQHRPKGAASIYN